ncbi:MAG: hypothetical protein AAF721_33745 [Myxococcota bacterium]
MMQRDAPKPSLANLLRAGGAVLAVGLLSAGPAGCAKKSPATESPGTAAGADMAAEAPSDEGAAAEDQLADLQGELTTLEEQLLDAGVSLPSRPEAEVGGEGAVPASEESARCTRVCGLADAICGLEANICALAADHEGDPRYEDACAQAHSDCERAQEACSECAGA